MSLLRGKTGHKAAWSVWSCSCEIGCTQVHKPHGQVSGKMVRSDFHLPGMAASLLSDQHVCLQWLPVCTKRERQLSDCRRATRSRRKREGRGLRERPSWGEAHSSPASPEGLSQALLCWRHSAEAMVLEESEVRIQSWLSHQMLREEISARWEPRKGGPKSA